MFVRISREWNSHEQRFALLLRGTRDVTDGTFLGWGVDDVGHHKARKALGEMSHKRERMGLLGFEIA